MLPTCITCANKHSRAVISNFRDLLTRSWTIPTPFHARLSQSSRGSVNRRSPSRSRSLGRLPPLPDLVGPRPACPMAAPLAAPMPRQLVQQLLRTSATTTSRLLRPTRIVPRCFPSQPSVPSRACASPTLRSVLVRTQQSLVSVSRRPYSSEPSPTPPPPPPQNSVKFWPFILIAVAGFGGYAYLVNMSKPRHASLQRVTAIQGGKLWTEIAHEVWISHSYR